MSSGFNRLVRLVTPLVKDCGDESVFFMPNQGRSWLDFVVSQCPRKNKVPLKVLTIGGTLYAAYLAALGCRVTSVEKSSSATLGQLYVAWLLNSKKSIDRVESLFLLDLIGDREKPHFRGGILVPRQRYTQAVGDFAKFVQLKDRSVVEELFNKIVDIKNVGRNKKLFLIKKGIKILGFENARFAPPQKLFITDIKSGFGGLTNKFDLIIGNNVIDFFQTVEEYFLIVEPLLSESGICEVTTYSPLTQDYIKELFRLPIKSREIGLVRLLKKDSSGRFKEYNDPLCLNKNVFIINYRQLKENLVRTTPRWLRELLIKGRPTYKYKLFSKGDQYIVCDDGLLKRVKEF